MPPADRKGTLFSRNASTCRTNPANSRHRAPRAQRPYHACSADIMLPSPQVLGIAVP